jgi:hypothetical protein
MPFPGLAVSQSSATIHGHAMDRPMIRRLLTTPHSPSGNDITDSGTRSDSIAANGMRIRSSARPGPGSFPFRLTTRRFMIHLPSPAPNRPSVSVK